MAKVSDVIDAVTEMANDFYVDHFEDANLILEINAALQHIAAGILLENGEVAPPLSSLVKIGTVTTTLSQAYSALPTDYQRHVFNIVDSSGNKIYPPASGDYYAFPSFLKRASSQSLDEVGSVHRCCVVGLNLYYQGIPASAETLTLMYHRKPATLATAGAAIEGIPDHLQVRLLKHYIGRDMANKSVDGLPEIVEMHTRELYLALHDLLLYEPDTTAEPEYYNSNNDSTDLGVCD
jgi:hypothetical protein